MAAIDEYLHEWKSCCPSLVGIGIIFSKRNRLENGIQVRNAAIIIRASQF